MSWAFSFVQNHVFAINFENFATPVILVEIILTNVKRTFPSTVLAALSDPICVSPIPHCPPIISPPQPGQYHTIAAMLPLQCCCICAASMGWWFGASCAAHICDSWQRENQHIRYWISSLSTTPDIPIFDTYHSKFELLEDDISLAPVELVKPNIIQFTSHIRSLLFKTTRQA